MSARALTYAYVEQFDGAQNEVRVPSDTLDKGDDAFDDADPDVGGVGEVLELNLLYSEGDCAKLRGVLARTR